MTEPALEFMKNEAGEAEGLGDAGIETFRDAPYASCAREAGQNSRDAADKLPVRMTFDVISVSHDDFPSFDRLKSALESCSAASEQEKEADFFSNALVLVEKPEIRVLRIADFNTKGLIGPPDTPKTPFHALLKGSGVNAKDDDGSLGSFGIGKNASFAVSDLQAVYYSTIYTDPQSGASEFAAQGKVKLISHTDVNGMQRRATGYWGNPDGFGAVMDPSRVPAWMARDEVGTSIFCMGFRESEDWAERMTYSLASNFFCAIHRNEMYFDVASGKYALNRNTLEGLLDDPLISAAADNTGHLADLEFARHLYRCLVSENSVCSQPDIPGLGKVNVRVLTEEGMPKRVGFVRNGMLITDNLKNFGQPLARFSGSRDFVVLVEPVDSAAGILFKKLENPAHNAFSAERISDPQKRQAAAEAVKKLAKKLRSIIHEATAVTHERTIVLDELGRLFAEQGASNAPPDPDAERDPEKYEYEVSRKRPKKRPVLTASGGDHGGGGGKKRTSGGGGGGVGSGTGAGIGGTGTGGEKEPVALKDTRNRIQRNSSKQATSRVLHFSPEVDGEIELSVEATGVNSAERLTLLSADQGTLEKGKVILDVGAGNRCSLLITFDEPYEGPIEVIAVKR